MSEQGTHGQPEPIPDSPSEATPAPAEPEARRSEAAEPPVEAAADAPETTPVLEYRTEAPRQDLRIPLILVCLLGVTILSFGRIVETFRATGAFVVGGAWLVVSITLWASGRARPSHSLGTFVAGLAFISIGVAYRVVDVPIPPNPATAEAGTYYSSWQRVQAKEANRGLRSGQRVQLHFEPGRAPVLILETSGFTDSDRGALAERLRTSFRGQYGLAIEVRFGPSF